MTILTIKKVGNYYVPYNKHYNGGIDIEQNILFEHICPLGYFDEFNEDQFWFLIKAHDWEVKIMKEDE